MFRQDKKNEFYTILAKKSGYPARSVYKLKEINAKYKIFKKGDRVLDLGCSPGSWLLYISQKIGQQGQVIGVDLEKIKIPQKANIVFMQRNIFDLKESDLKNKFAAVVSDLAPKTSGHAFSDAFKSLELAEQSLKIVESVLLPGGNFVCKLFENESTNKFFKKVKNCFAFAKRFRPQAVSKKSKELYIIGQKFISITFLFLASLSLFF
jgi:23S rRNA (uridine2552-2'-O)-methyltransferase